MCVREREREQETINFYFYFANCRLRDVLGLTIAIVNIDDVLPSTPLVTDYIHALTGPVLDFHRRQNLRNTQHNGSVYFKVLSSLPAEAARPKLFLRSTLTLAAAAAPTSNIFLLTPTFIYWTQSDGVTDTKG